MKGFKFKYLKIFTEKEINYAYLMKEFLGYKNRKFFRKIIFKHYFKKAYNLVKEVEKIDITKIEYKEDNPIKVLNSVEDISYMAMIEINALINSDLEPLDLMLEIVSRIVFSAYFKEDYSSTSPNFIKLKESINNHDFTDVSAVYNKSISEMNEKGDIWKNRFFDVEVIDADYDRANNGLMTQFNIIETLKSLCNDFNCDLNKAWQIPYSFVQTNNLSKASRHYVQDQLRQIKEQKMRSERTR